MGYVYAYQTDTIYSAIKLLSSNTFLNYAIDLDGSGGVDLSSGGYTTTKKYTTLSSNRTNAGGTLGSDVAHVVGTGGFDLLPGERETVAFAIIAGDSLLDIQNSAIAAQFQYDNNPLFVDKLAEEKKWLIYPNPTTGILFISVPSGITIEKVDLKNLLGETVLSSQSSQISLANYAKGIYIVEVTTSTGRFKQKIALY